MKQRFEHEANHDAELGKMVDDIISRQAAIDELSQRYIIMDNPHYIGYNAGLDEAQKVIKALPTVQLGMSLAEVGTYVPDMNAGDMISRRDATTIPVMPKEHRHYQTYNLDDAYEQGWYDLQGCIENLPPVQPKHGEWEYHSNPTIGINPEDAYCSCCGFRVDTTGNIDFDEYNFCPHCGVKMER